MHCCYLALLGNLLEGIYILLALISFFFFFFLNWAKLSQDLLDRFSRSFHHMEGICVNVVNPVHFFWFLKGRYHGNQFCVVADSFTRSQSISESAGPIFTIFAPHCRYWIADDQSDPLFRYLEGCCHGNQFSGKNGAKIPTPCTYRSAIPKQNGISQPQYALTA